MLAPQLTAIRSSLATFSKVLTEAAARRPELASFGRPADVAAALDASSPLTPDARYALVAALLAEHHASTSQLWGSLLLVAFTPMLLRVRSRMGRPEDDERSARVLAAFLEAVARVRSESAGTFVVVALQRAMLKALASHRASDRQDAETSAFDDATYASGDPHDLTLGDACVDLAWTDAHERKVTSLVQRRKRSGPARPRTRRLVAA